ncbi:hypothetical protein ACOSQ2_028904 [Xanthoceras sorbifolium]
MLRRVDNVKLGSSSGGKSGIFYRANGSDNLRKNGVVKREVVSLGSLNGKCMENHQIDDNEQNFSSKIGPDIGVNDEFVAVTSRLKEVGVGPVGEESDTAFVISSIQAKTPPLSKLGLIISDILLLSQTLSIRSFAFRPRHCNMVARNFAKFGVDVSTPCFWVKDTPPCVVDLGSSPPWPLDNFLHDREGDPDTCPLHANVKQNICKDKLIGLFSCLIGSFLPCFDMEFDELESLCASLSLIEKEGLVMPLDRSFQVQGHKKVAYCLVGKFLTNKLVNRDAFRATIAKIWKTTQGVEIEVIQEKVYAFHFRNQSDRMRVLAGGPWNFNNALLILQEQKGAGDIVQVKFRFSEFWVQIHHVPLMFMTKDIGMYIRFLVGTVKEVDGRASGDCLGRYLRVRVAVNVKQPLKRCPKVDVESTGKVTIMPLCYERLHNFCSLCGHLGHLFRECVKEQQLAAGGVPNDYSAWLRAMSPVHNGSTKARKKTATGVDRDGEENSIPGHMPRAHVAKHNHSRPLQGMAPCMAMQNWFTQLILLASLIFFTFSASGDQQVFNHANSQIIPSSPNMNSGKIVAMDIEPETGQRKTRWKRLARSDLKANLGQSETVFGRKRHSEGFVLGHDGAGSSLPLAEEKAVVGIVVVALVDSSSKIVRQNMMSVDTLSRRFGWMGSRLLSRMDSIVFCNNFCAGKLASWNAKQRRSLQGEKKRKMWFLA